MFQVRWYQFRLKSLLIATTLLCIALSGLTLWCRRAERQRRAIEIICGPFHTGGVRYSKAIAPRWLVDLLGDDYFCSVEEMTVGSRDGVKLLGLFPYLQSIEFPDGLAGDEAVTDADLAALRPLIALKKLNLQHTTIAGSGLSYCSDLGTLEEIRLPSTVTDEGIRHLAAFHRLRTLSVTHDDQIGKSLACLKDLRELRELDLADDSVTDAGMPNLADSHSLESLDLSGTKITDASLKTISGLVRLKHLGLSRTCVTDAGLAHLSGLTQLHDLRVAETKISNAGMKYLTKLTNLDTLVLQSTEVGDEGLDTLRNLASLKYLWARKTNITGTGFFLVSFWHCIKSGIVL